MQIEYKKESIGNNLMKLVVNNDCAICGDKDNISKLSKYFDELNAILSPQIIYHALEIAKLSKNLTNESVKEETVTVEKKKTVAPRKSKIMMDEDVVQCLKQFFNKYVISENSLYRVTGEEIYALAEQYCDEQYLKEIPTLHYRSGKKYNSWFADFFKDYCECTKHGNATTYYIKGRIICEVDPKHYKTQVGITKHLIDQQGGLKFLYECVKKQYTMKKIAELLSNDEYQAVPGAIVRYLMLYGFYSLHEWDHFIAKFNGWKKCKKALLKR